ncbi:hypothetical protein E4T56_gene11904 [Termitomyces sp. T112]|nr:hypothetical protein E4T56_gene11904 [Termitomyces sp. T112]
MGGWEDNTSALWGVVPYIIDELRPVPSARACSSCFIPDPTSLRSVLDILLNASSQTQPHFVRSLYFKLNANSQTQPHFVQLGPCISNLMLHPRPNLTSFVRSLYFKLNASSQTQPHFVRLGLFRSLYFKLNASSQTQPHFVRLGLCISNSMLSPRPNLTLFG